MSSIRIPVTFDSPDLDASSKLHSVLHSAIKTRDLLGRKRSSEPEAFWNAKHFGLERSSVFKQSSTDAQQGVLKLASQGTLEEAYYIEKSGMSFTAKMSLLSRTTHEQMLYSLFSADETIHLHHVLSYLPSTPTSETENPFIALLSKMIQEGDRECLVLLIQVVLEGWGIIHYHKLAEDCQNVDLRDTLRMILRDESRHHGSGMMLSREIQLNPSQRDYIAQTMIQFLRMIQCGPLGLLSALESATGPLTRQAKLKLYEELGSEADTHRKLELIRSLMIQGGAEKLIPILEKAGAFTPTLKECV